MFAAASLHHRDSRVCTPPQQDHVCVTHLLPIHSTPIHSTTLTHLLHTQRPLSITETAELARRPNKTINIKGTRIKASTEAQVICNLCFLCKYCLTQRVQCTPTCALSQWITKNKNKNMRHISATICRQSNTPQASSLLHWPVLLAWQLLPMQV